MKAKTHPGNTGDRAQVGTLPLSGQGPGKLMDAASLSLSPSVRTPGHLSNLGP